MVRICVFLSIALELLLDLRCWGRLKTETYVAGAMVRICVFRTIALDVFLVVLWKASRTQYAGVNVVRGRHEMKHYSVNRGGFVLNRGIALRNTDSRS